MLRHCSCTTQTYKTIQVPLAVITFHKSVLNQPSKPAVPPVKAPPRLVPTRDVAATKANPPETIGKLTENKNNPLSFHEKSEVTSWTVVLTNAKQRKSHHTVVIVWVKLIFTIGTIYGSFIVEFVNSMGSICITSYAVGGAISYEDLIISIFIAADVTGSPGF